MTKLFWLFCSLLFLSGEPEQALKLKEDALREKKHIAVYFCGSDWCRSCLLFKSETLNVPEVDRLLKEHFVFYVADFPQHKKLDRATVQTNEYLAEKLNPQGVFPVLVIADAEWNVKAQIYRNHSLSSVMEKLEALQQVNE